MDFTLTVPGTWESLGVKTCLTFYADEQFSQVADSSGTDIFL